MDVSTLPTNRTDAKRLGAIHYYTGKPCANGHIAPRKTKGSCVECLKEEWKRGNETRAEYFRTYNLREDVKERKHEWYEANREQVIAAANTRPLEVKREYQRAWKDRNVTWVRADTKSRRRKHREATPSWLSRQHKAEMRDIYRIAITMSKTTGERYVVDHIVPLRSPTVCGLHVPWNLRVMTQDENLRKSNKLLDAEFVPSPSTVL